MGAIVYNDITYNWFYLKITLLITVNKKHTCNVTFVNVISKFFISIVVVSRSINKPNYHKVFKTCCIPTLWPEGPFKIFK